MHQFFRLLRHSSHLALAVLGVPLCGQNLLPNPGMEGGGDRPAGWTLSGGDQGAWASPGHQGRRCLAITGDGKNSFCWRSEELSLRPGGLYRLRFWGRCEGDVTGGCVTAGSSRVNHDFRFTETWQPYSLVLAVPADGAKDFIRLGQWEQKGTVCFDDVELTPLAAISMGYGKALELGDGESLDNGVYRCVVNLGGPGGNYHHALIESRCGFNSDRWTFSAGQRVIYAHKLASGGFADARLKINMSYYVGGALKVEASPNGEAWETASVLDGARPGGEIELPPSVLSSGHIFIRLTGEGPSCNLQVSGYELEAALKEPRGAEVQGKTFFLESRQTCPELEVLPESLWRRGSSGALEFRLSAKNTSSSPLDLQVRLTMDGQTKTVADAPALPAGGLRTITVPVQPAKPGAQEVNLAISDARGRALFGGRMSVSLGVLEDPRPGYWLAEGPDLGLWWCESGWKIGREHAVPEKPQDGKAQPVSLSAARGEFEAAQVILNPRKPADLLGATVGPLHDNQGRPGTITAELLEVAYVKVTHPTDATCEPGWYPDPLPPLRLPLKLEPARCQPIWLSFHVDPSARAGDYTGELRLETSTGSFAVPLRLHVYGFELPRDTHLKSALGLGASDIALFHHLKEPAHQRQVYESYLTNFAAHRIAPYSFYDYAPIDVRFPGDGTNKHAKVDFTAFDREAGKWLDQYRFSTFSLALRGMGGGTFQSRSLGELEGFKEGTAEHARLFKDYLSQVEAHLRQRGWLPKAYTYWFDEPDRKDFEFVVQGMERIRAAAPGIRRMLTKEPEPELEGHVELWCGLTPEWTPEKVRARRAAGQEAWWYICCGPTAPYVTEFIDHPGTELRLWPWQSWQYGVQAILIWSTTYWTSGSAFPPPKIQDPWTDPMSYVSGYDFKPGHIGYWGNGDGRFLYPPREAATNDAPCLEAPVTSFRWENLRDGMEDYEYLWLLQEAVEKAAASNTSADLVREASGLLRVPAEISQDTRHFTTDPRLLLAHRDRVARLIERLTQ
ncbi:MAG: DUF4091 domain-containing protein [Limisphaerales bacterium]